MQGTSKLDRKSFKKNRQMEIKLQYYASVYSS